MKYVLNDYHRNVSEEELLDDMKRVSELYHSDLLTRDQYKVYGKYSYNTFLNRFGSWNIALQRCGLRVSDNQKNSSLSGHNYGRITDEQLLTDLQRVAEIIGKRSVFCTEYEKLGRYSLATFFHRFETWNNALEKASLEPFVRVSGKKINDEELFAEIERLWIMLGRQPTATDIVNGKSKYSIAPFKRKFGGWRKALEAFVAYINDGDNASLPMNNPQKNRTNVSNQPLIQSKKNDENALTKHKTQREPSLRLRFKVMMRDNFKCCACGASPAKDPAVVLHVDHKKAWSKGGETVIENLQTYCSKCNLGKGDLQTD